MPEYTIAGVHVHFPHKAYDCQLVLMEKVISSLKEGNNALLESPTGTGKTLCLLCSTLAWVQTFKASRQLGARQPPPNSTFAQATEQQLAAAVGDDAPPAARRERAHVSIAYEKVPVAPPHVQAAASAAGVSSAGGPVTVDEAMQTLLGTSLFGKAPRIIYASRTHSQLSQVVHELRNTPYRPKVVTLASRKQMCLHEDVRKLTGGVQTRACHNVRAAGQCAHYTNVAATADTLPAELRSEPLDVEELVSVCGRKKVCPYFVSRELMEDAEVIFLPYNYLVDPAIRKRLDLDVRDDIIIFDEAHNLESVCSDASSFSFSSIDIAMAVADVERCMGMCDNRGMVMAENGDGELAMVALDDLKALKALLLRMEQKLDDVPIQDTQRGFTDSGDFIFQFFAQLNINAGTVPTLLEFFDRVVNMLSDEEAKRSGGGTGRASALENMAQIVRRCFPVSTGRDAVPGGSAPDHRATFAQHYRAHVNTFQPTGRKSRGGPSAVAPRKLSCFCFVPGLALRQLEAAQCKSILLASGTLSPLSSFAMEMMVPFPVRLENEHVIKSQQLFAGVIGRGPTGKALNSSYRSRSSPEYHEELGMTLVNVVRHVPDGVLVFFPSYTVMDMCITSWKSSAVWTRLASRKVLVVEPRSGTVFQEAIDEYTRAIKSGRGGMMFAVCRGKVSEGMDFTDRSGRAVIITGLPYPPRFAPQVALKIEFMDKQCRDAEQRVKRGGGGGGSGGGVATLPGDKWYAQQALRAVNQALGRVIRHRHDFGAILLCDERFAQPRVQAGLSAWMRPYIHGLANFGHVTRGLSLFFKNVQNVVPNAAPSSTVTPAGTLASTFGAGHGGGSGASTERGWGVKPESFSREMAERKERRRKRIFDEIDVAAEMKKLHGEQKRGRRRVAVEGKGKGKPAGKGKGKGASLFDALRSNTPVPKPRGTPLGGGKTTASVMSALAAASSKAKASSGRGKDTARAYLSLVRSSLTRDDFLAFKQVLLRMKSKGAIDFDELVPRVRALFAGKPRERDLVDGLVAFVPKAHHAKYFEVLSLSQESKDADADADADADGVEASQPAPAAPSTAPCLVCHHALAEPMYAPCGHVCCAACWKTWFKARSMRVCPSSACSHVLLHVQLKRVFLG